MSRGALGLFALACGCAPEFESDLSRIEDTRVIALRSSPAEASPGDEVTVTALVASPDGTADTLELDWSLCLARKPLTTLAPIAPECAALLDDPEVLLALGQGSSIVATLPEDGCRRFGPEPPPAEAGESSGRPVDPDPTGGYYQPILGQLLAGDDTVNLLQTRITCGLAGATQAQSAEFTTRYQPNVAPALTVDAPATVEPGTEVELRVRWADCPSEPSCGDGLCSLDEVEGCVEDCDALPGCAGAETHVYFDPITLEVETRREAISVAWYATGGQLAEPRTGRASDDLAFTSANAWVAPSEPGLVHAWVVVRDDRGGVGWASFDVVVE